MKNLLLLLMIAMSSAAFAQNPPIGPGVSHELALWRAARYRDVRYKLNLTLEKMSPVLKGTIEISVNVGARTLLSASPQSGEIPPIVLDWRKIKGFEERSTISDIFVNGKPATVATGSPQAAMGTGVSPLRVEESDEHLIFRDGVVAGENVIKLDFTSPILTSGSAITRYIDKEDGSEYIYSLFVPSDASTAFPVFDQPDLKARFKLSVTKPRSWNVVSNTKWTDDPNFDVVDMPGAKERPPQRIIFSETRPISTYVFAFAAGPWVEFDGEGVSGGNLSGSAGVPARTGAPAGSTAQWDTLPTGRVSASDSQLSSHIYVRKSQAEKFKPHAAEVFRLNREGIRFLEEYFNYKFPFPKYDIVLIPEFPFGGMEHAGATFLRESSVIFPSEPTANDYISRATTMFHEAAHQWFGDTVTMRWFDDLWLKEGFAEFMAYKTLEKVMPQYNAWKAFYERNKPLAYATDSTRGTTPIYQEIPNLSAAKSAYGNVVYRKAPSFLRQAEFYLGPDKFQTAVRAFLKKHEYANAGWEDLVKEFENSSNKGLQTWANQWITQRGMPIFHGSQVKIGNKVQVDIRVEDNLNEGHVWSLKTNSLIRDTQGSDLESSAIFFKATDKVMVGWSKEIEMVDADTDYQFVFPNYQDYGYGIFLLDDKSRDYVLKNIQNEKDDFLRSMMWGALWDSVREGELDPREYVELAIKNIGGVQSASFSLSSRGEERAEARTLNGERAGARNLNSLETDDLTIQTILGRVSTAMTYYIDDKQRDEIAPRLEYMLIERMRSAPTLGQRVTFYRAFLNIASTENARRILKEMLKSTAASPGERNAGVSPAVPLATRRRAAADRDPESPAPLRAGRPQDSRQDAGVTPLPLKTKDRFDIVTKLAILNDPEAPKLLAELEKTETSDDAKRYAYAAHAAFPTKENREKFWNDFLNNKSISESWIEAAMGPFNSPRHAELSLPYLEPALKELPDLKRNRKIFFVNGWLAAFIGGQKSRQALDIVNKFLADNPNLDKDLRLKILENVDVIERAVRIRAKDGK